MTACAYTHHCNQHHAAIARRDLTAKAAADEAFADLRGDEATFRDAVMAAIDAHDGDHGLLRALHRLYALGDRSNPSYADAVRTAVNAICEAYIDSRVERAINQKGLWS